ncbi:MAG: bifunctional phosphopantothenoylcysteine decarboxylase/phosphopantothenate--cysteine ligase CoaBC [Thermoplasmata archaeon]
MNDLTVRKDGPFKGIRVVIALSGSVSIYRIPDLIRDIRREGGEVVACMSADAERLLSPEIIRWATDNAVITHVTGEMEHITLFEDVNTRTVLLIAPATYNTIGKLASGIADSVPSLLFSNAVGYGIPVVVAPAMHRGMIENRINADNIRKLRDAGITVLEPRLENSKAKIPSNATIMDSILRASGTGALKGKKIMIVTGRSEEQIDPVRVLTNRSSGITGYWLARNSYRLGADITIVGNCSVGIPDHIRHIAALSTSEFEEKVMSELLADNYDAVIVSAALSDFEVANRSAKKISSSSELSLKLKPRGKIIDAIRRNYKGFLVVFRLSSGEDLETVRKRFSESTPDLIVFNTYRTGKGPFGDARNSYIAISENESREIPENSKELITAELLSIIAQKLR